VFGEKEMSENYDLKGSKVGRSSSAEEKKKEGATLKDNDLIEKNRKIRLDTEAKETLLAQLRIDCMWLQNEGKMDYSLLVGMYKVKSSEDVPESKNSPSCFEKNSGGILSKGGDEIYYLAIIDFLQNYNRKKKAAHFFKSLRDQKRKSELSTVNPRMYASRFRKFLQSVCTDQ